MLSSWTINSHQGFVPLSTITKARKSIVTKKKASTSLFAPTVKKRKNSTCGFVPTNKRNASKDAVNKMKNSTCLDQWDNIILCITSSIHILITTYTSHIALHTQNRMTNFISTIIWFPIPTKAVIGRSNWVFFSPFACVYSTSPMSFFLLFFLLTLFSRQAPPGTLLPTSRMGNHCHHAARHKWNSKHPNLNEIKKGSELV